MRSVRRVLLGLSVGLLCAGRVPPVEAADPGAVVGRILLATAPAEIVGPGAGAVAPARPEGVLHAGDRIRTGRGGHVDFRLQPGILLRVREESTLELRAGGGQRPGGTVLGLPVGAVLLAVAGQARGHPLRIETPTVTGAVRGTEFGVAFRDGRAVVGVKSGSVEVFDPSAPGQAVLCTAGTQTTAPAGRPPAPPVPVTEFWAALLGEIADIGRRAPVPSATPEFIGPPRREY
jgi:ferric-dicitrate binding protein FerR (iron transport regulator)